MWEKISIFKSASPLVSTHYDYFKPCSLRQLKIFYFRVGLFKIFQPDIPKLCQNLSFLYSILAYNTSLCLAEITPNVAQHQTLTSFIFVLC